MNPRIAFLVAAAMGVVAVGLLQHEVRGGTVAVYRVSRSVGSGTPLRGALTKVSIPKSAYDRLRSTVPTEEFEDWIQSSPVVRDVQAGETVAFDMFLVAASEGLRITPGQRAVGIEARRGSQTAGFLARPGDIVDVLATLPEAESVTARIVLQAKRILAVDQSFRREDSALTRTHTYSTVTLEVSPAEAEMIEGYRNIARDGFSLALRGAADTSAVATSGFGIGRPH
jgi:Flp pilus assembly protein CpaB